MDYYTLYMGELNQQAIVNLTEDDLRSKLDTGGTLNFK